MFCQKCGKEIMDEAVICPGCGCPTGNQMSGVAQTVNAAPQFVNAHTADWPKIQEYSGKATAVKVWAIISMCLVLGVGAIPGFITSIAGSALKTPVVTTTNPEELSTLEIAKKKHESGKSLAVSATVINLCLWGMVILISMMGM